MSKITIDRELLEQAIAALSYCEPDWKENTHGFDLWANVLPPLREALAQPQQEPYGYLYEGIAEHTRSKTLFRKTPEPRLETRWWREVGPIYTSPKQPPPPPPECKTEAERTAYAFGWFKALETVNQKKEVK